VGGREGCRRGAFMPGIVSMSWVISLSNSAAIRPVSVTAEYIDGSCSVTGSLVGGPPRPRIEDEANIIITFINLDHVDACWIDPHRQYSWSI
jgi:hypothetical protein